MAKSVKKDAVGSFGLSGYLKVHAGSRPYATGEVKVHPAAKKAIVVEPPVARKSKT